MSADTAAAPLPRGGDRVPAATPAAARRAILARVRRRPGWAVAAAVALSVAGLAAIPQAALLSSALSGAFLHGLGAGAMTLTLIALLVVVALRALAEGAAGLAGTRAGAALTRALRDEHAERLGALGPVYLERRRTGVLGAEALEGADRVAPVVARFLPQVAACAAVPLAIALYALWLDPLSGVILLLTGPLIPLFLWLLGGLAEQRAQRQWRALGLLSAQALDALLGLETLRLFGRAADHERALAASGERYRRTTLDVLRVAFLSGFALELLAMLGTAMVAVSVGVRLAAGELAFPVALTTLLLAPEFYLPFRRLGAHHHAGMEGVAAMRDLLAQLPARPPAGRARAAAAPGATAPSGATAAVPGWRRAAPAPRPEPAPRPRGAGPRLRLVDVWARYPGQPEPALRGVDLELAPGAMTALVGPSGAGKSSVARLLIGTLEPERGRVLADGVAVAPARSRAWRERLAYVPQRPHLFAGSVIANLRLARPGASLEQVVAAARLAEADGFIRALPRGYATALGEDGLELSGGERHRLAIARAFLRDAEVVVLDEIGAYLDAATDAALTRATLRLAERCTLLVIAHRPETVRRAQRIVVLERGAVVEAGSHAALLARGGAYARLVRPAPSRRAARGAA